MTVRVGINGFGLIVDGREIKVPELEGKFNGFSLRVPTPTVSVVDFTADVARRTSVDELNAALSLGPLDPGDAIRALTEPLEETVVRWT